MPHRGRGLSRRATELGAAGVAPQLTGPLAERTNALPARVPSSTKPGAAAAPPPPPPPPPPLPPPPPEAALPGLEEDGLAISLKGGRLPLEADSEGGFAAYGCAFGDSLRVTCIARNPRARKISNLRHVMQPSAAEGRAAQALPPAERLALPLRTQAIRDGGGRRSHSGSRSHSASRGGSRRGSGTGDSSPAPPPAQPPEPAAAPEQRCEEVPPPLPVVPGAARPASRSREEAAPALEPAAEPASPDAASPACGPAPEAPAPTPAPEPASPSAPAPAPAAEPAAEAQPARGHSPKPDVADVYSGVSAAEEAASLPAQPPPPRWLVQQGRCVNQSGTACYGPEPLLSTHGHAVAEQWRAAWLSGLQWHNAWRAGQPVRAGSAHAYIPLDAGDPLMELFCFRTAVMPEQVVAGAARFQDLAVADPALRSQALEEGVLRFGLWGIPNEDGTYTLLGGGQQLALPMTFRGAGPRLRALFLACVWQEANTAEAARAACYTFSGGLEGERRMDERELAYPVPELHAWARWALGAAGVGGAAEAAVDALQRLAVFGAE